jgi:NifU-like protein involved in Fe-S cluster formation
MFWIRTAGERIIAADYRCSTCITLVALCEHLAELLIGFTADQAVQYTADRLLALHPEIPPERRNRAALAIDAMQSAAARLRKGAFV